MTKPLRTWWHELNTWEPDAARAFYGRTLGWEFEKVALPDAAEYWIARKEGKPVGGVFALSEPDYAGIPSHWMTYMAVADIGQAERASDQRCERLDVRTHHEDVAWLEVGMVDEQAEDHLA